MHIKIIIQIKTIYGQKNSITIPHDILILLQFGFDFIN